MRLDSELIYGFSETFLKEKFDSPEKTPFFHTQLWEAMASTHQWVAIAAPRGHAKSTAGTVSYILAATLFKQNDHVLILSDTEAQACQFLGNIKDHLINNESLRQAFHINPVEQWEKDTESEIIFSFENGKACRIFVRGSEQGIRGSTWRTKRPNLVVMDDGENDDIVLSDERRVKFKNKFLNKIIPLGSKKCLIRIVGTILHTDSLLESLLSNNGADYGNREWTGLMEAPTKKSVNPWYALRFKAHNEDFSEILWPEMFSEERLKKIRGVYSAAGNVSGYAQEYLNNPIDQEDAYFKKDDLKAIVEDGQNETMYISCDFAISQKDSRAFTAMVVAGVTETGIIRVRDVKRFRGDALDIIETLFLLVQRYKPDLVFIEQENIARTLGALLYSEMETRQCWFSIEMSTASQDKFKRARSLQARYRAGSFEVDNTKEWFYDYAKEFFEFGRSKYMDQVDATAWLVIGMDKLVSAPTNHEIYEQEYNQHLMEVGGNQGQNAYTGY